MLQKLFIKNYALIDHLDMDFSDGLTIITGETGAGKSIILGGLSLILGERINKNAVKTNTKKCVIEGTFDVSAHNLKPFFELTELDYENPTIIRREITPSGKSRAFINDTPVRLPTLKKLGQHLISLLAQHQTLHLFDPSYQLGILDMLANHAKPLHQFQEKFRSYQKACRQLEKLKAENAQIQRDLDYILFLLQEFEEAKLEDPKEQDKLETELKQLSNADTIRQNLSQSMYLIENEEHAVITLLQQAQNFLNELANFGKNYETAANRIESVVLELQDLHNELGILEGDVEMNPERLEEINERLQLMHRLQKKHQVNSLTELLDIQEGIVAKGEMANNLTGDIEQLEKKIAKQKGNLDILAQKISKKRQVQAPILEQKINTLLTKVGMPNATIKASIKPIVMNANGIDHIELLFAANKGHHHGELKKVASGGELSRLMLCVQSLIASKAALPTLIFDEIDTGISGEVALKVGTVLQQLAQKHQLVSITHLPQIASKGKSHYFVYKDHSGERTVTRVKRLTEKERIREIAKMLSGDRPGQMAMANAQELLAI